MLTSPPTAGAYRYRAPVIEPDYPLALSYDDVLLVPRRSGVGSRSHPVTTTRFSRRIRLELPVVSANMDTVTEHAMAAEMARLGGLGVIHRFLSVERQCAEVAAVVAEGPENDRSTPGR
jgi:IMP dehydrogenase